MKAYSLDLREKILGAVEGELSKSEAAPVFGVGLSTVKRSTAACGRRPRARA